MIQNKQQRTGPIHSKATSTSKANYQLNRGGGEGAGDVSEQNPPNRKQQESNNSSSVIRLSRQLKPILREILKQYQSISEESILIQRVWYKGRSQFKSALWWKHFDSVRRSILYQVDLFPLFQVYTCLWSIPPSSSFCSSKFELPKYSIPANQSLPLPSLNTQSSIQLLQNHLEIVKRKCKSFGTILQKHLNTPPAPTFATNVFILFAFCAKIHSVVTQLQSTLNELSSFVSNHFSSPTQQQQQQIQTDEKEVKPLKSSSRPSKRKRLKLAKLRVLLSSSTSNTIRSDSSFQEGILKTNRKNMDRGTIPSSSTSASVTPSSTEKNQIHVNLYGDDDLGSVIQR